MSTDLDPPSHRSTMAAWSPKRRGFFPMQRVWLLLLRPQEKWESWVPTRRQILPHRRVPFPRRVGKFLGIGGESLLPFGLRLFAFAYRFVKMRPRSVRNKKCRLHGPAEIFFRQLYFFYTQRRSVGFEGVLFLRRAVSNMRVY